LEIFDIGVSMSVRDAWCGKRLLALAAAWIILVAAVPFPAFARALSSGPACQMSCARRANCCCKPRPSRTAVGTHAHDSTFATPFQCASEECATPATLAKNKIPKATRTSIRGVFADAPTERTAPAKHGSLLHLTDHPDHSRAPPAA
jgi:hypothetical protein